MAVEVQDQDDAEGWLPSQAQAAHDVNDTGAEPGDEAKLYGDVQRAKTAGLKGRSGAELLANGS